MVSSLSTKAPVSGCTASLMASRRNSEMKEKNWRHRWERFWSCRPVSAQALALLSFCRGKKKENREEVKCPL